MNPPMMATATISTIGLNWLDPTASALRYQNLLARKLIRIGMENAAPKGNPSHN